MDMIDLKARFKKWLLMPDYTVVDVVMGCIVANVIPGEATNIYIVGPSGTGKTEVVSAAEGFDKVQGISKITANTLVSGFGKKGSSSLIHKLTKKGKLIIVMKDFTTVLSARQEVRSEILGQIREIADGKYDAFYGNDEETFWKGKLAFIAGVTNVIDEYASVIQTLGERFLYFRIPKSDPMEVSCFSQANAGLEQTMKKELLLGVRSFMMDIDLDKKVVQTEEMGKRLQALACMVSFARSVVSRNRYTGVHNYIPEPEGPARITKQLTQLAAGIALANGKEEIDEYVYGIIKRVATDTIPSIRYKIIDWMVGKGLTNGNMATTSEVSGGCRLTPNTTRHYLEDFESMGVVRRELVEGGNFRWGIGERFAGFIKQARLI